MEFEAVIGLEVHAQLNTASKIFCACPTAFGAAPNSQTCPVCQGHPGVLPVLNAAVLEKSVTAGLALGGEISRFSKFDRKNYFYPDLPKAYQVSQYDLPIVKGGAVAVTTPAGEEKTFRLNRIHMEEDAGKLVHPDDKSDPHSYVDLNRCGTPLIEIVSEADLRTSEDAYLYLSELKAILRYIDVSDCNMEEGSLRCDANVSIRPRGQEAFGTRAEIKNLNSFKNVVKAIDYEIKRQAEVITGGGKVVQETRLYDANKDVTVSMRSKEEAHDYRYFPDPDLVPIVLEDKYIDDLRAALPELPRARKERFVTKYGITAFDAQNLCADRDLAEYFEESIKAWPADPKKVANFIQAEVLRLLNERGETIGAFKVTPAKLGGLFQLLEAGTISGKIAKEVVTLMAEHGADAATVVKEKGLTQVTDTAAIEAVVDQVLAANPSQVEQYKAGKTTLLGFFVGQIMKASQGKANPQVVNELLAKKLGG